MPLVAALGVGSPVGLCALARDERNENPNQNRCESTECLMAASIETFQQGTFGPGAILSVRVADETPAEKTVA